MTSPSDVLPAVLAKIDADLDSSLERLFAFLKIQSVSTDPAFKDQCKAAAEFVAKANRQVPIEEAVLFPIQARPEFREQVLFSEGQRCLAYILVGSRMRKQNHRARVSNKSR